MFSHDSSSKQQQRGIIQKAGNVQLGIYYLKIYFDVGYFIFFIPFRFPLNSRTGFYEIRTTKWRKILSFVIQVGTTLDFLKFLTSKPPKSMITYTNIPSYLNTGNYICGALYLVAVIFTYFKKSTSFSRIFYEIGQNSLSPDYISPTFRQKSVGILICLIFIFLGFTNLLIALNLENFGLLEGFESMAGISGMSGAMYWFKALASILLEVYTGIMAVFADFHFLSTIFLYWQVTREFYSSPFPNQSPNIVIPNYKKLKYRVKLINDGLQYLLLGLTLSSIPFLALDMGVMMVAGHSLSTQAESFRNSVYGAYIGISFGVAAHCHSKITQLEEWIHSDEHYSEIQAKDLNVLLHNVNANKCGLTAAGGIFTITYAFLGSVIVVVVGYAVIVAQNAGSPP